MGAANVTNATKISLVTGRPLKPLLKLKEKCYKETCLSVIGNSKIFNFLGIHDIDGKTIDLVVDEVLSIRDDQKILLTSLLINRWFYCRENNVFVKHVKSKTKNVLHQIILGDSNWDGIYEFCLKGIDIDAKGCEEAGVKILEISSPGNYDVVLCESEKDKNNEEELSITRFDMGDSFYDYLISNNYITKQELEVYASTNNLTKQYLEKTLPNIRIK